MEFFISLDRLCRSGMVSLEERKTILVLAELHGLSFTNKFKQSYCKNDFWKSHFANASDKMYNAVDRLFLVCFVNETDETDKLSMEYFNTISTEFFIEQLTLLSLIRNYSVMFHIMSVFLGNRILRDNDRRFLEFLMSYPKIPDEPINLFLLLISIINASTTPEHNEKTLRLAKEFFALDRNLSTCFDQKIAGYLDYTNANAVELSLNITFIREGTVIIFLDSLVYRQTGDFGRLSLENRRTATDYVERVARKVLTKGIFLNAEELFYSVIRNIDMNSDVILEGLFRIADVDIMYLRDFAVSCGKNEVVEHLEKLLSQV